MRKVGLMTEFPLRMDKKVSASVDAKELKAFSKSHGKGKFHDMPISLKSHEEDLNSSKTRKSKI